MALSSLNLANVISVAGGYGHSLAVTANGQLYGWGLNADGQVGDGTTVNKGGPVRIGTATDWVSVACGDYHSVARKADGTVWAWGRNGLSQAGQTPGAIVTTPTQVTGLGTSPIIKIVAVADYTLALASDTKLYAFGANNDYLLAPNTNPSTTARYMDFESATTSGILDIAAARTRFAMVKADHILVKGKGDITQSDGFRGDVTYITTAGSQPTSGVIPGSSGRSYVAIALGAEFLLAIGQDGTLYGFTTKSSNNVAVATPIGIHGIVNHRNELAVINDSRVWLRVACGIDHALLTDIDGNAFSVGSNTFGQLARATNGDIDTNIVQLDSPANSGNWSVIGCGNYHSLLCVGS